MKNCERYGCGSPALEIFEAVKEVLHMLWCYAEWLDCEYSDDELTYLRNLEKVHILSTPGFKRLHKLEKEKGGAK